MSNSRKFRLFCLSLLSLFLISDFVQAQQGSKFGQVKGVVSDATTGETLIGVNVGLQGTSLGSPTDFEGVFDITRVPAGTYLLVASSIGYETRETEIEIISGETLELSIELTAEAIEGEEVVISAQAEGQRQAINEQLTAREIKNVVSAEKIRELPDQDAATALGRLPGVYIQEGTKVAIRGLEAKYNTVSVNGVQLPATGLDDRSTELSFISSNMLSGIEVTKAVTPAMDANSIGGTVNLRLKEAPENFHGDLLIQDGWNTQNNTFANYKIWGSLSNRFLDNKLGAFFQLNATRFDGGANIGTATYLERGEQQNTGEVNPWIMSEYQYQDRLNITEEFGGSLILDYRLPNGKLVLQNTIAYTNPDNTTHSNILSLEQGSRQFQTDRNIINKQLIINALQGEHVLGEQLGLKLQYGVSHAYSKQETDLIYNIQFVAVDAFDETEQLPDLFETVPSDIYDIQYFQDAIGNTAGNGAYRNDYFTERQIGANLDLILPLTLNESISGELQAGGSIKNLNRKNDIARWFARLSEGFNNRDASEFLTNEVGMENWNSALAFRDFRDNDYDRAEYFLGGAYNYTDVVNTDYMDQYMRLAITGWPRGENAEGGHIADSFRNDYTASEVLSALYFMGDFNIGSKLNILGGVRYESFTMDYDANYVFQNHFDGNGRVVSEAEQDSIAGQIFTKAERTIDHFFPNLQLRYSFTDWFDARFAYTKTLSRPDYTQLIPNIYVDGSGSAGQAGNPYLDPAVSQNFDLYLSFYANKIGLFTIGAFSKTIEGLIVPQSLRVQDLEIFASDVNWPDQELDLPNLASRHQVSTFVNNECPDTETAPESCAAKLRGIEIGWQTQFWYLPKPFSGMVLDINYTRTFSEMNYHQISLINGGFDPITGQNEIILVDTTYKAPLLFQGDDIINVALGADYKGFSGRVSFRYQGEVVTGIGSRSEEHTYTEDFYSFDFTIKQKLPVEGLDLFINGINITHRPTRDYMRLARQEGGPVISNENRVQYNPRRFQVGVRYSF